MVPRANKEVQECKDQLMTCQLLGKMALDFAPLFIITDQTSCKILLFLPKILFPCKARKCWVAYVFVVLTF